MSILKNAIDSIAIGLEDYSSTDQRRVISCTRNIFAGILLLFKHKLSTLSPPESDEALIKQKILPILDEDSNLYWIGKGGKTVDVQGIKERFNSLHIDVDWERLDKINSFRNNIEHYYSNLKHDAIQSLIADSFLIINEFIKKHLDLDPKEILGDDAWSTLIEVNEVYEKEKSECAEAIQSLTFIDEEITDALQEFTCTDCGSGLITPSSHPGQACYVSYTCKSCDKIYTYEEIVEKAIEEHYSYQSYISYKDGGESPLAECPECGGTYLFEKGICALCGHTAEHECVRCGALIPPEELSCEPFCGYCAYVMSKDD